ncbi:unnamed protein product [Schistosoma rodhaini]|nr:unnamed protein product [Schistosoma rodhaini]
MIPTKEINTHEAQSGCSHQLEICANNDSKLNDVMHSEKYNMKDDFNRTPNEDALETNLSFIDDIANELDKLALIPFYFCLDIDDEIYHSEYDYNLDN